MSSSTRTKSGTRSTRSTATESSTTWGPKERERAREKERAKAKEARSKARATIVGNSATRLNQCWLKDQEMQSKGCSKGSWPEKGWGQKGQEKGKGKGGKGKGAMNNPWGSWWNNAAPAASGLNWIDGPPGMGQPAWGGEQWGDTSLFSLQPEVPNIIKKPVSLHNRWKALQQEDEDINYDLTDTKGPTGNIKEEFEQAGWKVVQKTSQSTLHGCLNLPKTN